MEKLCPTLILLSGLLVMEFALFPDTSKEEAVEIASISFIKNTCCHLITRSELDDKYATYYCSGNMAFPQVGLEWSAETNGIQMCQKFTWTDVPGSVQPKCQGISKAQRLVVPAITKETKKKKVILTDWIKPEEISLLADVVSTGDLIEIDRSPFLHKHWVVFAEFVSSPTGDQEPYVIHFGMGHDCAPSTVENETGFKSKIGICYGRLADVANLSQLRINNYLDNWGFQPAENADLINQRIRDFIDEGKDYDTFRWNCEHFATSCRYGVGLSLQIILILTPILTVLVLEFATKFIVPHLGMNR